FRNYFSGRENKNFIASSHSTYRYFYTYNFGFYQNLGVFFKGLFKSCFKIGDFYYFAYAKTGTRFTGFHKTWQSGDFDNFFYVQFVALVHIIRLRTTNPKVFEY